MAILLMRKKFLVLRSSPIDSACWTQSGTFKDGDLRVNKDGVRIVSQSEPEVLSPIMPTDDELSLSDLDMVKVIGKGSSGLVQLYKRKQWCCRKAVVLYAGKVEETPRPLKDVIVVSYEIIHKKDPATAQKIKLKEVYEQQKELILNGEKVSMGFGTIAAHSLMGLEPRGILFVSPGLDVRTF